MEMKLKRKWIVNIYQNLMRIPIALNRLDRKLNRCFIINYHLMIEWNTQVIYVNVWSPLQASSFLLNVLILCAIFISIPIISVLQLCLLNQIFAFCTSFILGFSTTMHLIYCCKISVKWPRNPNHFSTFLNANENNVICDEHFQATCMQNCTLHSIALRAFSIISSPGVFFLCVCATKQWLSCH